MTYFERRLSNGLTILAEPLPTARSFSAGLFVRTGSRDEPSAINGVSHFLEHMMFKGSRSLDAEAMNRIFDELGARYNAFTTQEMTAYYATVLPEFTTPVMEHLGQLLRPAIRQSDFDTEKNVILEEIAMYEDDPGHRLFEMAMADYFKKHPLGMSILGPADAIRAMNREQMEAYFHDHYGPLNMVLSVTGRFDIDEVSDLAQRCYGGWKAIGFEREITAPQGAGASRAAVDPKLGREYLMGLTPGPSAQDDDRFAARILADIYGDSDGSRLYWALVDNALCDEADYSAYPHDQAGNFVLSITCDPGRGDDAIDIARKEFARLREDLSEAEVERAKNKIAGYAVLHGESPTSRMRSIGSTWVYNRTYRSLGDELRDLLAVKRDDLLGLMEKYPFDPMTVVKLGPA